MKLTTEMLEKMGVTQYGAKNQLAELFAQLEEKIAALEAELEEKEGELEESKKLAAIEKAILEAGGRNAKAILALVDTEAVRFDGRKLTGLDLDAIRSEAPYLFHEKEEKRSGTGVKATQRKKEQEISAAFKKGLRR